MNRWLKWGLGTAAVIVIGGAAALLVGKTMGEAKLARIIKVQVQPVALTADSARIEHGHYLYTTRGCAECHGADGAGRVVVDEGGMLIIAPNISPGPGSVIQQYSVSDWVRTLRHGVKPDGRPVLVMPSEDYAPWTDDDVSALISYVTEMPPVPGKPATIQIPAVVKTLYAVGQIQDAAEKIDHNRAPSQPVAVAVTKEYGAYVANACIGCHGPGFSGGHIPGSPPAWPPAANLTPGEGSALVRYPTPQALATMLRTGKRPDGSVLNPIMPFSSLSQLTETDLAALHLYLQSLPPRAAGNR